VLTDSPDRRVPQDQRVRKELEPNVRKFQHLPKDHAVIQVSLAQAERREKEESKEIVDLTEGKVKGGPKESPDPQGLLDQEVCLE